MAARKKATRRKVAKKAPRRKASRRRKPRAKVERALVCRVGADLVKHNPLTGKKFKAPRCVVIKTSKTGRKRLESRAPRSIDASKIECNKGYRLVKVNPKTGTSYAQPRCALITRGGKVKTHAPKRPRLPKGAVMESSVKVSKTVSVAGLRGRSRARRRSR